MNKINFDPIKYQLPAILWAIFILGVCTYPFSGITSGGFFGRLPMDKLVHIFLFLVLCYLSMRGTSNQQGKSRLGLKHIILLLSIALIYGIIIELIQHFFTTKRTGDILDVLADGLGSVLAIWVFQITTRKRTF